MSNKLNTDLEIDFKRSVVHKIKEYPVIWNAKSRLQGVWKTDTRAAWDDVQAAVDFPLKRLKLLWASFRRHYFDILLSKTIERDNNFPKWKLFHDMSFMYPIMINTISERLGGMTPPLFKPHPLRVSGARRLACPCCLPNGNESNVNSTGILIGEPHTLPQTPIEIYDLSDTEDLYQDQTTNSFEGQQSEDSLCESNEIIILKESLAENSPSQTTTLQGSPPSHEISSIPSDQISLLNEPLSDNSLHQLIENSSLQLQGLLPGAPEGSLDQSQQRILLHEQLSENSLSQTNFSQGHLSESSLNQSNPTIFFQEPLSENSLPQLIHTNLFQEPLSQSNTNQFNPIIFFQEPLLENNEHQSNQTNSLGESPAEDTQIKSKQRDVCPRTYGKGIRKPKCYIPREELAVEREKIIEAIRPYPILYARAPYKKNSLTHQTWKKVAAEVGLEVHTVTNRWRLIKQRYVEEIIKEQYSNGEYQSNWNNFEQMSFMRDYLKADVDDIDRMRQKIQTLVNEKKSRQTIDLCSDDEDMYDVSNGSSGNTSTNTLRKIMPRPRSLDASQCQINQSIQCDQPVSSKEQPEDHPISNITTMDLTDKELDNSNPSDADKGLMNSYQQAFERSITSIRLVSTNDDTQCAQPTKNAQAQPNKAKTQENQKSDVQVIELDPSSDEEDNVICVDDDDSAAESEVEMYTGISSVYICPSPTYAPISSVYISPSPVNVPTATTAAAPANIPEPNSTICLDDDD